ncbi:hypothetical protein M434DRAFT_28978 [Hypoxylon sp. CO27-5]|nr:hypothetical protein M434DRAFT_28978 [Hypoxylon sp. CO27-5]
MNSPAPCVSIGTDWEFNSDDIGLQDHPELLTSWLKAGYLSSLSIRTCDISSNTSLSLHDNTIPIRTWIIIELVGDPELLQVAKEEISHVGLVDEANNELFNHNKAVLLPLLQSVYIEIMRLHTRVLVTGTTIKPVTIAGYHLLKGSVIQAPTEACPYDETVRAMPDHPASEFWGYRHIKEVESTDNTERKTKQWQFSLENRVDSLCCHIDGPQPRHRIRRVDQAYLMEAP